MEVLLFKLVATAVIFTTGVIFGQMPMRFEMSRKGKQSMVYADAFSAGIFFGAALLHMMPDANENFGSLAWLPNFPFAALICGVGFVMLLGIEKGFAHKHVVAHTNSNITPMLLVVILSIHSIIAGASFGLETALMSSLAIFIAIIAHKGAAAFALGSSLRDGGIVGGDHLRLVLLFAVMTPIGIGLGSLFGKFLSGENARIFEALFDALAAGTFLYVGIVDILSGLFHKPGSEWNKVILVLAGFLVMALVAIWT